VPAGLLLALAIAVEVAATLCLRASDGFTRPLPSVFVVIGYLISFWLLAKVLKEISVGTTYAIWAGAGTAAIALIGMVALDEPVTLLRVGSLVLIVVGVVGLNVAGGAH
jgi:small multidrug resistance pump